MKNNLLSEKLIYTGDSLTPTHLHLCTYNATEMQESANDTFQGNTEQRSDQLATNTRNERYGDYP